MENASSPPKLSGMNYRVVKPLGNGAGSTILLISDKNAGGRRYALKVVRRQEPEDDVYVAQARTEFEVSQKLNHPSIVKIYDCRLRKTWFKTSGVELLEEYVDGKTLDELEAPELGQLVLIFAQVAPALMHMHRRGIYHGDLKPSNVMLSRSAEVKLIDFGTAWVRGEEKNRVQGTPQYIAPEQVNEKVVDDKTDIYNFGATMYRMFTGRFANQGLPTAGGDARSRKLVPPKKLAPAVPDLLNDLIVACLEISPERRPPGMHEISGELQKVAKFLGLEPTDLKGVPDDDE